MLTSEVEGPLAGREILTKSMYASDTTGFPVSTHYKKNHTLEIHKNVIKRKKIYVTKF